MKNLLYASANIWLLLSPVLLLAHTNSASFDRPLVFDVQEVSFNTMAGAGHFSQGGGPAPTNKGQGSPISGRRFPF